LKYENSLDRFGNPNPITNKVKNWWFWDGEKSWMVGRWLYSRETPLVVIVAALPKPWGNLLYC
jgi:hypothetical protein